MKSKFILSIIMAAFTFSAGAATFRWVSAAGQNSVDKDGNTLNSTLVYVVSAVSNPDPGTPMWDNNIQGFGPLWAIYGAGTVTSGDVLTINQTTTGNWGEGTMPVANSGLLPALYPTTVTTPNNGSANNRDYYFVFFDGATLGTSQYWTFLAATTVASGGAAPSTDTTATFGPTVDAATLNALGTGAGQWQPIPEPTSLALLAIGVAAIGLRRRFRK